MQKAEDEIEVQRSHVRRLEKKLQEAERAAAASDSRAGAIKRRDTGCDGGSSWRVVCDRMLRNGTAQH